MRMLIFIRALFFMESIFDNWHLKAIMGVHSSFCNTQSLVRSIVRRSHHAGGIGLAPVGGEAVAIDCAVADCPPENPYIGLGHETLGTLKAGLVKYVVFIFGKGG